MRFPVAWANTAAQNSALKAGVVSMGLTIIILGISLLVVSSKKPLLIERSCFTKALPLSYEELTSEEIKSFLKKALEVRFNSRAPSLPGFLSFQEEAYKEKEQERFSSRKLIQTIIINNIELKTGGALITADRLISVGDIRSAFKFPLAVTFLKVKRTKANPYGLILNTVKNLSKDKKESR